MSLNGGDDVMAVEYRKLEDVYKSEFERKCKHGKSTDYKFMYFD